VVVFGVVFVPATVSSRPVHGVLRFSSFPHVILVRTPYNRNFVSMYAQRFSERGYVVVLQDTRGRFQSEGRFETLVNEKDDGVDTLRWIKQQVVPCVPG